MKSSSEHTDAIWPEQASPKERSLWFRRQWETLRSQGLRLDCSALQAPRSEDLAILSALQQHAQNQGSSLLLRLVPPQLREQLRIWQLTSPPSPPSSSHSFFEGLGSRSVDFYNELRHLVYLFSESLFWSSVGRWSKRAVRFTGVARQMQVLGSSALGIVFSLSFLIGLTLAFQSAVQLEPLGAAVFLVRGVGISMFSEIGPLMTAIILAGRSGSAITAEISTMVVQEEVKALRAMGVPPVQFLVLPRFLAMSLMVPLLTYLSVFAGLLAGLAIAIAYLGLPFSLFISELRVGVPTSLVWQCGVKALVFGWIITLVACHKGLHVRGGADAVGRATTQCVVFSIASIILADALFSFLFYWN